MRSPSEINQEYEQLCTRLGNVALKREDLDVEERAVRERVAAINVEMRHAQLAMAALDERTKLLEAEHAATMRDMTDVFNEQLTSMDTKLREVRAGRSRPRTKKGGGSK